MKKRSRAANLARFILIGSTLILPTLSLVPLGGLYLWQNGYLLLWALAAFMTIAAISLAQFFIFRHEPRAERPAREAGLMPADMAWSPLEQAAWADVEALAANASLDAIADPQAFLDLGRRTIEVVARRVHPEKSDALWRFTLPEALTIAERVSRRLAGFVHSHVPFGDRMTLAQFWAIYRWRRGLEVAEKAYDVWRLMRIINPATALTHEARERLSRAAYDWGRDHVNRRLASTFVEEVGRAAIDLYSGRLKFDFAESEVVAEAVPSVTPGPGVPPRRFGAPRQAISAVWALGRALVRRRGKNPNAKSN